MKITKYSTEKSSIRAYDIICAYADPLGIEDLDGLYDWEDSDPSNVLILCDDLEDAKQKINQEIEIRSY